MKCCSRVSKALVLSRRTPAGELAGIMAYMRKYMSSFMTVPDNPAADEATLVIPANLRSDVAQLPICDVRHQLGIRGGELQWADGRQRSLNLRPCASSISASACGSKTTAEMLELPTSMPGSLQGPPPPQRDQVLAKVHAADGTGPAPTTSSVGTEHPMHPMSTQALRPCALWEEPEEPQLKGGITNSILTNTYDALLLFTIPAMTKTCEGRGRRREEGCRH